ncbi:unnamed protein product, partial [Owenia fusiformis]
RGQFKSNYFVYSVVSCIYQSIGLAMPSTLDDYETLFCIGTGSYGKCKKIRRKRDGKVLVWKEIDYGGMSETEKQMLVSEVNLLRELKHKHIVQYYDRIIDRSKASLYIVMEFCEGGDLSSLITKCSRDRTYLEEEFIWKILTQILQALEVCHQRKNGKSVLHRDLKPANVFLDASKNVKLGDFGLARVLHHDTSFAKTFVGTPYYMSPEQVNNKSYNEKSDVWSLGCLLYELCALNPPFTARNQRELNAKIRVGRFTRIPYRYSSELNDIVSSMIVVDENKRPSIRTLLDNPLVIKRCDPAQVDKERERERKPSPGVVETKKPEVPKKTYEDLLSKERELERRERAVTRKENELESREKRVALKEQMAEDKLARVNAKADKMRSDQDLRLRMRNVNIKIENTDSGPGDNYNLYDDLESVEYKILPAPCLVKERKPDSPKKHVSFGKERHIDLYGKDNELLNSLLDENPMDKYGLKNDPLFHKPTSEYESGFKLREQRLKTARLKDRLERARVRSANLRTAEFESKLKSRQLLGMR